jgi:hypothetical protein
VHAPQYQSAERPQGPHRPPAHHNYNHLDRPTNGHTEKPSSGSFGAGIFE